MYYYEHTNGEIISKPDIVVDGIGCKEYFDSPFVKRYWYEASENEGFAEEMKEKEA